MTVARPLPIRLVNARLRHEPVDPQDEGNACDRDRSDGRERRRQHDEPGTGDPGGSLGREQEGFVMFSDLAECGRPSSTDSMPPLSYSGYHFPPDIIQRVVWMYRRFTFSFRDVEDLLAERGLVVA
jgi:hypothetical protein